MGGSPPSNVRPSPGFKSPEARTKFFVAAGLAAAAVTGLLVLLRIWLGAGLPGWENVHAESAAVWRGDVWYVSGEITTGIEGPGNRDNNRLVHLTEQGPTTVFTLAPGPAWLIANGDTLWIFASDGVSRYDGKKAEQVPAPKLPESASPPFLLGGVPAAVEDETGQSSMRRVVALEKGQWVEKARVFFDGVKDAPAANRLKALEVGNTPYVFCANGGTLYCHEGFPGKDARFPADWETVGPVGELWAVAANNGRPEAFTVKVEENKLPSEIVGFARNAAGGGSTQSAAADSAARPRAVWKSNFSRGSPLPLRTLGAATDSTGGCCAVYQALQWTVNVARLNGDAVTARRYGDITPADRVRTLLRMLPPVASGVLSVALAVVLSGMMKACRTDGFSGRAGPVQWASLTRRALALLLDAALVVGPLAAGMIALLWILPGIEDRPAASGAAVYVTLILALFVATLWAVAAFLLLCYTLGRWGRTPGKWAAGIRVLGVEMAPCGFARALLRSVLLFVDGLMFMDGMMTFGFGALVIACTVNRQRLGDMAARTIVIRDSSQPAPVHTLDTRG